MQTSAEVQPVGDVPLPPVYDAEIDAVVDYLRSKEHSQRKPEATAKILVLAVKLFRDRTPWPTRPAVSKHLGVSLPLVDTAISQRRAQNMIKVVIETTQGFVKQRQSVITHKFIEPCEELVKVVESVDPAFTVADGQRRARAPKTAKSDPLVRTG